jgi:ATP-dependent exoDNAse (exonuclease V) beta subunit
MPSRFARQPWQKVQEDNLMYVAYTRAQSNLYFMG